jgi:hypothetical protein
MSIKMNLWSFVASLLCLVMFFIAGLGHITPMLIKATGVNPWYIVLFGSAITLIFGFVGFGGRQHFNSRIRSVLTTVITLGLSVFSIAVIVMGNLFQFT